MTFFEELKRRKVYRVAVAYVIAAGGIIQLASAVFPGLGTAELGAAADRLSCCSSVFRWRFFLPGRST